MLLSVIVPVFHGTEYINNIIKQCEDCLKQASADINVELILVNDAPEEVIDGGQYNSDLIQIVLLNSDINRGIHGARVFGLSMAKGDYVVFLDQDDKISEDYIKEQLENIELHSADASVCKATENGKAVYNNTNLFENTVDHQYMISNGNGIVSPGQVLIKREAISEVWKQAILRHNGADDWLLWICMMGEQKKFVLNDATLFEHTIHNDNTSFNTEEMLLSEWDMYQVISNANIYDEQHLNKLENLVSGEAIRHIRILEKFHKMFAIYDKWLRLECEKKERLPAFLNRNNYKKIVVYGVGYIGQMIIRELSNAHICIVAAIDRNAQYINTLVPVVTFEEFSDDADLIILTQVQGTNEILAELQGKTERPCITIAKLLESWEAD